MFHVEKVKNILFYDHYITWLYPIVLVLNREGSPFQIPGFKSEYWCYAPISSRLFILLFVVFFTPWVAAIETHSAQTLIKLSKVLVLRANSGFILPFSVDYLYLQVDL